MILAYREDPNVAVNSEHWRRLHCRGERSDDRAGGRGSQALSSRSIFCAPDHRERALWIVLDRMVALHTFPRAELLVADETLHSLAILSEAVFRSRVVMAHEIAHCYTDVIAVDARIRAIDFGVDRTLLGIRQDLGSDRCEEVAARFPTLVGAMSRHCNRWILAMLSVEFL